MQKTDLVLYNGRIHTMADSEVVSAAAVSGGRITAVGADEDILPLCSDSTECIDLNGACVVPGFNDSHCHMRLTGESSTRLDLRGVGSREEIVERGRRHMRERPPKCGEWVVGFGFDQNLFPDGKLPDIKTAQAISDTVPVILGRICTHVGTANLPALQAAGFDETTVIPGGVLDRGTDGKLNGILKEAAFARINACIPKPDLKTVNEQLRAAMAELNRFGVTSAQTDDTLGSDIETIMASYHALEANGEMTVRVFEEVEADCIPILRNFLSHGLRTGHGSEWFKIGNIKLFADGSLGARTAWLREDYADQPGNRGVPVHTQAELDEMVLAANEAGMQVACHAIGDGAVEACVCAFEKAQAAGITKLRNRIVHCQFADTPLFHRMSAAGINVDAQPPFTATDWTIVASRTGGRGSAYAWRTMLETGVHTAGGSDSPVETPDPLWGIYCAVTRQDANGRPAGGWIPDERLSVEEAVRLYTSAGAYASLEEDEKGTLQPGKLADFVILSEDIFSIPPEEIKNTCVLRTVIGGKTCYNAIDPGV